MFRFDSTQQPLTANATVKPPHFPARQQQDMQLWAARVVERIRSEAVAGRLRVPRYIDLTKNDATARKAYDEMLTEPMVMTPLRVLVDAVASLDLQVNPQKSEEPREQEVAEFTRWTFRNVQGGKLAIIRAVGLNGLRRAWSVTEKVWDRATGRYDTRWTWRVWKDKDTAELDPLVDSYRNLTGIRSRLTGEIFDPADFVVYTHLKLFQNPLGLSALRVAYDDYIAKKTATQLWGLNLEKWGSPFLKGTYTDEATQKAALEEALTNAEANTWITVPTGTLVEVIHAATGTAANYQGFLERCDKGMAIGIMGSHLPIMEGSNQTVAGSTREQRGTTELFQWALAEEMGQLLTQAVAELVRVNWGDVPPPTVTLGAVSESEVAAILDNATKMHALGADLSKRQLYSRTGWEPPRDDADKLPGASVAAPPPFMFAEGETPPGSAPLRQQVALPGADGRKQADLLGTAQREGVDRLGKSPAVR